jgi:hypothetical protein
MSRQTWRQAEEDFSTAQVQEEAPAQYGFNVGEDISLVNTYYSLVSNGEGSGS